MVDAAAASPVERHFCRPHGVGRLAAGGRRGRGGKVASGALIELSLQLHGERIEAAAFQAFGCPATIACGSWLAQWLPGRSIAEARALTGLQIAQALELEPGKTGLALVAEDALQAALADA